MSNPFPLHQRGRVRYWLLLPLLVLAATSVLAGLAWRDYRAFADAPLALASVRVVEFARGTRFKDIVRQLRRERITRGAPFQWRVLGAEMKVASKLHAGEYAFKPGLTPRQLLQMMAAGKVMQHPFTIIDGWSFRQLRLALAQQEGLLQTVQTLDDATLAERLDIEGGHPEGWFLPETYAWVKGDSDMDLLKRSHAAMQKTLDQLWPQRAADIMLQTPYEALILASIIEKETGVPSERKQISGVFSRRLKLGMRLQTDPTVIYGIADDYDGRIRRRHLDTDTPYNTYTRAGLPPTPIALAGRLAIEAALHPDGGNTLYFVARGDGSHEFSPSLDAHNRAVSKYILRRGQ